MNKTIKWVFGGVVILLVLGLIAGVAYLAITHWGSNNWMMNSRSFRPGDDWRDWRQFDMPMMWNYRFPGRWFPGFFPLGMICSGLFWVAVIFLSVYGAISLFRSRKTQTPAVAPVVAASSTSEAVAATAPAQTVNAAVDAISQPQTRACANCGQTAQEDWSHCPYCGQPLG